MKQIDYMPKWKKAIAIGFAILMPFIGSINHIAF